MKSSIFEGICTECRNRCFEQKLLSTHKVVKNKVIPKHLEQKIKNNFDWYIGAACVSLIL